MQTDTWGCGCPGIIPKCVLQDGQCLVSSDILFSFGQYFTLWPFTSVLTMALSCLTYGCMGASSTLAGDSEEGLKGGTHWLQVDSRQIATHLSQLKVSFTALSLS